MQLVIPTLSRSDRTLLALSLAFFAVAGVANTAVDANYQSLFAVTVAIAGVYGVATYAKTVNRVTLARVSFALWWAFLSVAAAHLVGLQTVAGYTPLPADVATTVLVAATWATLLGASASTAFLGFREYGAHSSSGTDTPEDRILDL